MEWLPDECKHCDALKSFTVATVMQKFQISALLVSCFTCVTGWASLDQQQALLKAGRVKLLEVLDTCAEESQKAIAGYGEAADVFALGPKALGELL